uniref:Popeye domain-containing protein 3 n=1 Tax=Sphaerodactylus townsendi TaxID=933632 RepID=A0ACB8GD64_9SAUR
MTEYPLVDDHDGGAGPCPSHCEAQPEPRTSAAALEKLEPVLVSAATAAKHRTIPGICYGSSQVHSNSWCPHPRIRVTVDGEFLHYIFPLQFLDSPEWDSLRPTEEGIFQVTLTAETDCQYVAWRRKKLYLLFAKHRYISRLFSILVGSDIADKLYALNDRVNLGKGFRFDIRLPNFYHMSVPQTPKKQLGDQLQNNSTQILANVINCSSSTK